MSRDESCDKSERILHAGAKEEELEPKRDRTSVWSALAAVGIGIAGSWC